MYLYECQLVYYQNRIFCCFGDFSFPSRGKKMITQFTWKMGSFNISSVGIEFPGKILGLSLCGLFTTLT